MLHRSTVEEATFLLLKNLLTFNELATFYLVGGTALSLKHGHRISDNLDLFSTKDFNTKDIIQFLIATFGSNFKLYSSSENMEVFCTINNVKVDFIKYHYFKNIASFEETENIRFFSDKDIAAMKIYAILSRAKKKDFFDLAELLNHFSLAEIIAFYNEKFPENRIAISIPKALVYFEDAEISPDPISLNKQTWPGVKKIIQKTVRNYLK